MESTKIPRPGQRILAPADRINRRVAPPLVRAIVEGQPEASPFGARSLAKLVGGRRTRG